MLPYSLKSAAAWNPQDPGSFLDLPFDETELTSFYNKEALEAFSFDPSDALQVFPTQEALPESTNVMLFSINQNFCDTDDKVERFYSELSEAEAARKKAMRADDEIELPPALEVAHCCGALTLKNLVPTVDKKRLKSLQKKQNTSEPPAKKTPRKNRQKKLYLTCPFPDCHAHCTKAKGRTLFHHLLDKHNLQAILKKDPNATTITMEHGIKICVKCNYAAKYYNTFGYHQNNIKHLDNHK